MKQAGIRANRKTKFRFGTTDSKHKKPVSPNRLEQKFDTESINQVWLTDLTYLPTREGCSYLCAVEDLHSRRIVSWSIDRTMDTTMVLRALNQAIALPSNDPGLNASEGSIPVAMGALGTHGSLHADP